MSMTVKQVGSRPGSGRRIGPDAARASMSSAVLRAAEILEFLIVPREDAGVRAIARTLKIDKMTTMRILRALETNGFVERLDGGSRYALGPRNLQLGMAYLTGLDVRAKALPYMESLRKITGESVGLNIRAGDERIYVELLESPFELKVKPEVGRPYPLYSGAPGRVLLAHLPAEQQEAILSRVPLVKVTPRTVVDIRRLQLLLDKTRADGYAIAVEETILGVATVAAPVRDHRGVVVAAVSITAPISRGPAARMSRYKDVLLSHAQDLSGALGWLPQHPPTAG